MSLHTAHLGQIQPIAILHRHRRRHHHRLVQTRAGMRTMAHAMKPNFAPRGRTPTTATLQHHRAHQTRKQVALLLELPLGHAHSNKVVAVLDDPQGTRIMSDAPSLSQARPRLPHVQCLPPNLATII